MWRYDFLIYFVFIVRFVQYDAEIAFWESKAREQKHQMDFIIQETARYEATITNNEIKVSFLSVTKFLSRFTLGCRFHANASLFFSVSGSHLNLKSKQKNRNNSG